MSLRELSARQSYSEVTRDMLEAYQSVAMRLSADKNFAFSPEYLRNHKYLEFKKGRS